MSFSFKKSHFLLDNAGLISEIFQMDKEKEFLEKFLSTEEIQKCTTNETNITNYDRVLKLIFIINYKEDCLIYVALLKKIVEIHQRNEQFIEKMKETFDSNDSFHDSFSAGRTIEIKQFLKQVLFEVNTLLIEQENLFSSDEIIHKYEAQLQEEKKKIEILTQKIVVLEDEKNEMMHFHTHPPRLTASLYKTILATNDDDSLWKLMQFMSYLNPNSIPIKILQSFTNPKPIDFFIERLSKLAIVKQQPKETCTILTMSQTMQCDIKEFMTDEEKQIIHSELISLFLSTFPYFSDNKWENSTQLLAVELFLHIENFIFLINYSKLSINCQQEFVKLLKLVGIYLDKVEYQPEKSICFYSLAVDVLKGIGSSIVVVEEEEEADDCKETLALVLINQGNSYYYLGQASKALDCYKESLAIQHKRHRRRRGGFRYNLIGSNEIAISHLHIGNAYFYLEDHKNALKNYEKSIKLIESQQNMNVSVLYNNLGLTNHAMHNFAQAIEFYFKSLEISEKQQGGDEEHLITALALNNLGLTYFQLNNFDQSMEFHQKALKKIQKIIFVDNPFLVAILNNIGNVCYQLNDQESAHDYHSKAMQMIQTHGFSLQHPSIRLSFRNNST